MKENSKMAIGVVSSALLLASMGANAGVALADTPDQNAQNVTPDVAANAFDRVVASVIMKVDEVKGTFCYTQEEVTPTDKITRALNDSPDYLCGSDFQGTQGDSVEDWVISVKGDVANQFSATLEELEESGRFEVLMGCNCAGNPADGASTVNADVTGITVASILAAADVDPDANTVVFASADGYEVALPLDYVMQRPSLIVYAINGEEMTGAVGGVNQLWLGSTSARYFVRNVETITFESRVEAPPVPGTEAAGDTYANVPNIGVQYGGAA